MSRPRWQEYPSSRKKAPPEDGIRMKKAGATWWGKRWIAALEEILGGQAGRLARGRTYARAGRVHDLVATKGQVAARVTGTAAAPYRVTMTIAELPREVWAEAIVSLASKAQFAAELLGGQMPEEIDAVFRAAGRGLFLRERGELRARCSCPDSVDPCKHIAATHYLLGEALDRDPFLLFELRGRTRDEVLDALREARGTVAEAAVATSTSTNLGRITPAEYDRPREPLPALHFVFDPVDAPEGRDADHASGSLLRQLGAPPGWDEASSPADAFAPLVRSAAQAARRVALAEPVIVRKNGRAARRGNR